MIKSSTGLYSLLPIKRWGLVLILLLHVIASYYYIAHQNITFDEPQYIEYAKRWLHGKPERTQLLDDSKSPVIAICWMPRIVRQIINPNYRLNDYGRKDQAEGRYMMIVFSLLAALYVYKWCRDLYGGNAWILPLVLLLFDPLFLAYSTLITTDLACGTFLIALLYHYRKYLLHKKRKQLILSAFYTALGIVTKQTMLFVLLLLPLLLITFYFIQRRDKVWIVKQFFIQDFIITSVVLVIINAVYYFHHTFIPFGQYHFQSHALSGIQSSLSFLKSIRVPLPEAFLQSVDMLKAHAELGAGKEGSTFNGVYLFGKLNLNGGYWYYYIVLLFYKMPIGTMLLLIACVPLFIKKFNSKAFAEKYIFLLLPIIFFWIILSFFNDFQIGVRHILLVFPLLFIGLGRLFVDLQKAKFKYQAFAAVAVVYTMISIAIYYPYIIPYTNEFVADKKTIYKKILDSSIDYGQADSSVATFIATHPGFKIPTSTPAPGKYAITMSNVLNHYSMDKNAFNWLQRFEAKGLFRGVVLLYDINEEDLFRAGIKRRQ